MAHVVSLGNSICHKLGIGPRKIPDLDLASCESAQKLAMDEEMIVDLLAELQEGLQKGGEELFK